MSDISEYRDSVIDYWRNRCMTIQISPTESIAINKNRQTIVYIGNWDCETGLPHGQGKQYKSIGKCERDNGYTIDCIFYPYGKVSHKGTWNQGIIEGFGLHWYSNGTMYSGNWKNNKPNGYGKLFNAKKDCRTTRYMDKW